MQNPHHSQGHHNQNHQHRQQDHSEQQKGSLQLWRFLVTMLDDPASQHLICWAGRKLEFKLNEPEEVITSDDYLNTYEILLKFHENFRWRDYGVSRRTGRQ